MQRNYKSLDNKNAQHDLSAKPEKKFLNQLGFFLVVFSALLYINTLNHDYVLDDFSVIVDNTVTTKGLSALPEIFTHFYRYGYFNTDDGIYRPLSVAMFAIEWSISPNNPRLSHFINILCYSATAWFLFQCLVSLFSSYSVIVAFCSTLLFVVQPLHSEVVANIKSRDEILAFLFSISALILLLKYTDTQKLQFLICSLLVYFLALLSKESSIVISPIYVLSLYFFRSIKLKQIATPLIGYVAVSGIFLFLRYKILLLQSHSELNPVQNSLLLITDNSDRLATIIGNLGKYLCLLVWPYEFNYDYSYNQLPAKSFSSLGVWLSITVYVVLLSLAIWELKKKTIRSFAILFYLIALLLFSNLFLLIGAAFAERFTYFASLGIALLLTTVIISVSKNSEIKSKAKDWKTMYRNYKFILIVVFTFSVFYAVKTINRNLDWKNNLTLFSKDLVKAPKNARAHAFYANELLRTVAPGLKNPDQRKEVYYQAIKELETSLSIYPNLADACTNLAQAYLLVDSLNKAELYFRKTLELEPQTITALGEVLFKKKEFTNAIAFYKSALVLHPKHSAFYFGLGLSYGALKNYKDAVYNFERAKQLGMTSHDLNVLLDNCYKFLEHSSGAKN